MMIEAPVYLEALLRDFLLAKGNIVVCELQDISELQLLAAMGWLESPDALDRPRRLLGAALQALGDVLRPDVLR